MQKGGLVFLLFVCCTGASRMGKADTCQDTTATALARQEPCMCSQPLLFVFQFLNAFSHDFLWFADGSHGLPEPQNRISDCPSKGSFSDSHGGPPFGKGSQKETTMYRLLGETHLAVAQINVPKWHLGKWNQRLKPA